MNQIPPEILTQIISLLPRRDLRTLCQISKNFQALTTPLLFYSVSLKFNVQSFDRLGSIAEHEELSKYIRYINYDPRILNSEGSDLTCSFRHFCEYNAGEGFLDSRDERKEFLARFSRQQLEGFYKDYRRYLGGQESLFKDGKRIFGDRVGRFTGLVGLSYHCPMQSFSHSNIPRGLRAYDTLTPLAQQILAQPQDLSGHRKGQLHFWDLLESASLSGLLPQLTTLEAYNLPITFKHPFSHNSMHYFHQLTSLLTLTLEISEYWQPDGFGQFWAMGIFSRLPQLRNLTLKFVVSDEQHILPDSIRIFPRIFTSETYFARLERLSLMGFETVEMDFREFLRKHRDTLKVLDISLINFITTVDGERGDGQRVEGSWIEFFHFLNKEMQLEDFKLAVGSWFKNGKGIEGEIWTVSRYLIHSSKENLRDIWFYYLEGEGGVRRKGMRDCLKWRIERFCCGDGSSPFMRVGDRGAGRCESSGCGDGEGNDEEEDDWRWKAKGRPDIGWVWEEDESWAWKGKRLPRRLPRLES